MQSGVLYGRVPFAIGIIRLRSLSSQMLTGDLCSSQAIPIPYTKKAEVSFFRGGSAKITSNAIIWAAKCVRENGEKDAGELFLQWRTVDAHRGQCTTTEKLFNVLRDYYLEAGSRKPWHALSLSAITAIHNKRKSSRRHTATFWSKVGEKTADIPPMVKKQIQEPLGEID